MPYLEHYSKQGGTPVRVPITTFPFRIGRNQDCEFVVLSREVSKEHAEIFCMGNEYRIRDLRSTNGTFINGSRIIEAPLSNNAHILLGAEGFWFRAGSGGSEEVPAEYGTQTIPIQQQIKGRRKP